MRRLFTWLTAPQQVRRIFERYFRLTGRRTQLHPAKFQEAHSILLVRPDHLGDVVLTSAFLREFRRNWPEAEITLLVRPECRPLVEHCPYVNYVEEYARFQPRAFGRMRRLLGEVAWARRHLWPRRFELAVVPRWDTQLCREASLAYLSGAKWRVGYSEEGNTLARNDDSAEILYTHLAPAGPPRHEVQKSLDLLAWMGGAISDTRTEVWVDNAVRKSAAKLIGSGAALRVAMAPGSSSGSKRWPAERYGELAAWMTQDLGWQVILVGTASEADLGQRVEACGAHGVVNLVGRTNVAQTPAVLELCQLYVGNDTGPMHIAAALGKPVVEICCHPANGSPVHERSPRRFGPWGAPAWIAQPAQGLDDCREWCIPDEQGETHCMLAISTDEVKKLVLEAAGACGLPISGGPGPKGQSALI